MGKGLRSEKMNRIACGGYHVVAIFCCRKQEQCGRIVTCLASLIPRLLTAADMVLGGEEQGFKVGARCGSRLLTAPGDVPGDEMELGEQQQPPAAYPTIESRLSSDIAGGGRDSEVRSTRVGLFRGTIGAPRGVCLSRVPPFSLTRALPS